MENIQYISLDINNNYEYDYLYMKQYDIGRKFVFTITEDGEELNLSGIKASFLMHKPDGTFVIERECDIENNKVIVVNTKQMSVLYGKLPFQIDLWEEPAGNEQVLYGTVTGYIICDKAAVQNDEAESQTEAINLILDARYNALLSKSYAVGGTDMTHDGIDDDYDNSHYFYRMNKELYQRAFIGKQATLYVADWDDEEQTQTIEVDGVIANQALQIVHVVPSSGSIEPYIFSQVLCIEQGEGTLTFKYQTKPEEDLNLYIYTLWSNDEDEISFFCSTTEVSESRMKPHDEWIQPGRRFNRYG